MDFYLIEIISVLVRNYYYFLLYIVSLLSRAVRRLLCILYVSSDYRTCNYCSVLVFIPIAIEVQ